MNMYQVLDRKVKSFMSCVQQVGGVSVIAALALFIGLYFDFLWVSFTGVFLFGIAVGIFLNEASYVIRTFCQILFGEDSRV